MTSKIVPITNPEEYVGYYGWIKDTPAVETTPEIILSNLLMGHYAAFKLINQGLTVGIIIFCVDEKIPDTCFVIQMYCERSGKEFVKLFEKECADAGIKKIRAISKRNEEAFLRWWSGAEKKYSLYEKEI